MTDTERIQALEDKVNDIIANINEFFTFAGEEHSLDIPLIQPIDNQPVADVDGNEVTE